MLFNSVTYLVFLTITTLLFWRLSANQRLWLILAASCFFYGAWKPEFLGIMFLSVSIDFYSALRMQASLNRRVKNFWLLVSLTTNLAFLFIFKYFYFAVDNISTALNFFGIDFSIPYIHIILPLGISFYTFEAISYVVDVHRGFMRAEKNFLKYTCFIIFFPKLIAGPILRAREIIPQFTGAVFRVDECISGLERILYGLFLKVVLADNISTIVDAGFLHDPLSLSAIDVWTLSFLFGLQIYFDFSAYSSIAIGSARLMGIKIPENFNYPYFSSSPREFWQRWHISLSSWIRDYLYLPLLGVKVHDRATGGIPVNAPDKLSRFHHPVIALFFTWGVMGLWHGASWGFVVWGIYHACLIFGYRLLIRQTNFSKDAGNLIGWLITLPLVMLGWIPFRAANLNDAFCMLAKVLDLTQYSWLGMRENTYLITAVIFICTCLCYLISKYSEYFINLPYRGYYLLKTLSLSFMFFMVFVFIRPISQFIYFQF